MKSLRISSILKVEQDSDLIPKLLENFEILNNFLTILSLTILSLESEFFDHLAESGQTTLKNFLPLTISGIMSESCHFERVFTSAEKGDENLFSVQLDVFLMVSRDLCHVDWYSLELRWFL